MNQDSIKQTLLACELVLLEGNIRWFQVFSRIALDIGGRVSNLSEHQMLQKWPAYSVP